METHRLVLPEDLNQYGFLFGGRLLGWIDVVLQADDDPAAYSRRNLDVVVNGMSIQPHASFSIGFHAMPRSMNEVPCQPHSAHVNPKQPITPIDNS